MKQKREYISSKFKGHLILHSDFPEDWNIFDVESEYI